MRRGVARTTMRAPRRDPNAQERSLARAARTFFPL
jgi:hypothetical protein